MFSLINIAENLIKDKGCELLSKTKWFCLIDLDLRNNKIGS
jgi:hypothetical protein